MPAVLEHDRLNTHLPETTTAVMLLFITPINVTKRELIKGLLDNLRVIRHPTHLPIAMDLLDPSCWHIKPYRQ